MDYQELSWRERGRLWLRVGIRLVLTALVLLFAVTCLPALVRLTMPFVLALVVAWLLNPLVCALQKKCRLPRGLLSFLSLMVVLGLVSWLLFTLGHSLFVELRSLGENYPSLLASVQDTVAQVNAALEELLRYLPQNVEVFLENMARNLTAWAGEFFPGLFGELAKNAGNVALSIPSFVVSTVVFLLASYFLTADYPRLRSMVLSHLPQGFRATLSHMKSSALGALAGYIRAELMISLGVFVILLVGFLVIQQPYAVLLAVILAIMDFIPIIGSGTFMVPWAVIDVLMGNWPHAVALMAVWGVVCVFRQTAEPKAVGSQTGLSPIASLVSMYVGMRLIGVFGMILGPIVTLVVLNIIRAGVFDGVREDFVLCGRDLCAILRHRPHVLEDSPRDGDGPPQP